MRMDLLRLWAHKEALTYIAHVSALLLFPFTVVQSLSAILLFLFLLFSFFQVLHIRLGALMIRAFWGAGKFCPSKVCGLCTSDVTNSTQLFSNASLYSRLTVL